MARLYANENFPCRVVEALRRLECEFNVPAGWTF